MPEHSDLFQRLRTFIQLEAETQTDTLSRQWQMPLAQRVQQGKAIEGLKFEGMGKENTIRLSCQTNDSRFREGDILVLHRGDPQGIEAVQVVIEADEETSLEVTLQKGNPIFLQKTPEGWLADEGMLNLAPMYRDALEEVADSLRGREIILPMLSGNRIPLVDIARCERAQKLALDTGLDESQALAVAQAYGTDLYHLIQGPPGTGKTTVLGHLVGMFVSEGQRVLITGLTHRAINNALNKVYEIDSDLPICKIGISTRGQDLRCSNYENFFSSEFRDFTGGYAIGATPFATRTGRLAHVEFDIVIFDEASQITLPLAIMGMLAGKKFIFIGDEHQLQPIVISRAIQREHASIFGYLSGRGNETMLTTTYRMNDVLTAWPSRTFYDCRIQSDLEVADRRLSLADSATEWDHVLEPESPLIFVDVGQQNTTIRSQKDAEIVCEIVEALVGRGIHLKDIGIVVPYRAQARLIRNLLSRLHFESPVRDIVVDTVERMQGQEREVILISLTTSSSQFATNLAEFFFQPERLNVSITRSRTKLIIVGSRHVLNAKPQNPEHQEWVELFRDLLNTCTTFTL